MTSNKYIDELKKVEKFGPSLPPYIVSKSEDDDSTTTPVIVWLRRNAPYELKDLLKEYNRNVFGSDSGLNTDSERDLNSWLPTTKMPYMLGSIVSNNVFAVHGWIYVYSLEPISKNWNIENGVWYLSKIASNDVEYPINIRKMLRSIIDWWSLKWNESSAVTEFAKWSNKIGLYIPHTYRSPDNIPNFFFSSIYWMRKSRPIRNKIYQDIFSSSFTPINLYLITSNPFEHYAARKLLSYHDDNELFSKYGRIGNYLLSKQYKSKQQQLDAFVALSLYRFGYFTVENFSRPIKLKFHLHSTPIPTQKEIVTKDLTLDELLSSIYLSDRLFFRNPINGEFWSMMPVLRLSVQIYSSSSYIKDIDAWSPLFDIVSKYSSLLHDEYKNMLNTPYYLDSNRNAKEETLVEIPENFKSLEQQYDVCLLCNKVRSQEYFGLCGHGVCAICQSLTGSIKCPFCDEHFVSENISNNFISALKEIFPDIQKELNVRIINRTNQKNNRIFRFDWGNADIKLYG